MRITPLDIRKQEFRKTMRGLDSDEVYAFLSTVAEEYEAVLSDNKKLREKIVSIEESLQDYKKIESNLRNTLLTAERVTKEATENARKEAGLIVREAEVEAERAAETIRAHTQQLRREILELKKQKDNYLTRFKTLIESHRKVLGGFEEDFAEVDREIERVGKKVEEDVQKSVPPTRISREKITEEYAHGPKDKVTWGEERKREDEPRPSMPKPDWEAKEDPKDDGGSPQNMDTENHVGEANPAAGPKAEQTTMPHIDTQPIAIDAKGYQQSHEADLQEEDIPEAEIPGEKDSPLDEKVRESIAHGIEEKFYPGVHSGGGASQSPPEQQSTPGGPLGQIPQQPQGEPNPHQQSGIPQPQPGAATMDMSETEEEPKPQDHWKEYEVKERKPDWSSYEISPERRPAAAPSASDNELDEALSGLKETPRAPEHEANDPGAVSKDNQDKAVKQQPAPRRPAVEPTHPTEQGSEKKQDSTPDETSEKPQTGDGNNSTWSMEELRKNLTNISKPEKHQ